MKALQRIVIALFFSVGVCANEDISTKAVMNKVYESFLSVMPYVYSDKEVTKKNLPEVLSHLGNLEKAFSEAGHTKFLNMPGFKSNLDSVTTHLRETTDAFNANNILLAKPRLEALTMLCMNCHGQLGKDTAKNSFGDSLYKVSRERFSSDLEYANYLFLIRRHSEAQSYYEKELELILSQKNKKNLSAQTNLKRMKEAFRKVLALNLKINFTPNNAIEQLNKYKRNPALSSTVKKEIDSWLKGIDKVKAVDLEKYKIAKNFIEEFLNPLEKEKIYTGLEDMTLLMASGFLTKYMSDKAQSDERAEILYWQALAERRLSNSYFYSLPDLYLKECITKFPKTDFAKKCFDEYQEALSFGYTGSSGTEIPDGEKKELERLKSFLK